MKRFWHVLGVSMLVVLTFLGLMTPWLLLSFTFLIGCGTALFNPSWQASMGDIVPRIHALALELSEP